jgi:hypothetical protein
MDYNLKKEHNNVNPVTKYSITSVHNLINKIPKSNKFITWTNKIQYTKLHINIYLVYVATSAPLGLPPANDEFRYP